MATWSMPSFRAAFAMIGSMIVIPCTARRALCAARRRVRQHGHPAPSHGLWLVVKRDHLARSGSVTLCVVRAVIRNHEHINREDSSVFGKADLHSTLKTRPRAS